MLNLMKASSFFLCNAQISDEIKQARFLLQQLKNSAKNLKKKEKNLPTTDSQGRQQETSWKLASKYSQGKQVLAQCHQFHFSYNLDIKSFLL